MVKKILPVVLGLIAANLTVFLIEMDGHKIHPDHVITQDTTTEQAAQILETMPITGFLIVAIAWTLGGFIGCF